MTNPINITLPCPPLETRMNTTTPRREPVIPLAVDRLEKLAAESDELVERLQGTFSLVLSHGLANEESIREPDAMHGSDLGQALMRIAERI